MAEIILSLFILFLTGNNSDGDNTIKIVVGILGFIITAIAGLITLMKFKENWIEYQAVAEAPKM